MIMVDEVSFPREVKGNSPLALVGHGITDVEIHFLQIKYTAIGIYMEKCVTEHLRSWNGKKSSEMTEHDDFYESLVSAPIEKFFRVVVINEIKGSQYGFQLESAVRDRLAAVDKYEEEEEEEELEKVTNFFQGKYFKKGSIITFHFLPGQPAKIVVITEGKDDAKIEVNNQNVIEMMQKWYLGGSRAVSQTTVKSLAENLERMLNL